jgi:cell fate (sporulation/competence/biofilm development) regulator YlbF (YheA/YmcA/DUF963 family)
MEKRLSNIDISSLKEDILNSKEYKEYISSKEVLDNNKEIKEIVKSITTNQKRAVKTGDEKVEEELDTLYEKLYSYDEYNNYIEKSNRLNILISDTAKELEDYFNSLVE